MTPFRFHSMVQAEALAILSALISDPAGTEQLQDTTPEVDAMVT